MGLLEDIKTRLREGIVEFAYRKVDGTERMAKGTTDDSFLEEHNVQAKGTGTPAPAGVIRYYDIDSEGWRSFRVDNFIGFL